jgi:hypothetical protein
MNDKYKLFSFGDKQTDSPEDNKTTLESTRSNPVDSIATASKENLQERKRKRRSDAGKTRTKGSTSSEQEIIADQLQALYSQEAWRPLVTAPANAMLSITGHGFWDIPKGEADALASTSAMSARFLLRQDPKWLALILFLFNFGTVYGTRTIMELQTRKQEKDAAKKKIETPDTNAAQKEKQ